MERKEESGTGIRLEWYEMEWAERSMDTQTDRQTLRMMMTIIRRYIIGKKGWQSEPG